MSYWGRRGQASGWDRDNTSTVYIDGNCKNNGRDGARAGFGVSWGPNNPLNVSERVSGRQTNQRAELQAAHRAIEQARSLNMDKLTIKTDSKFVVRGMTEWIDNWKENGWKTASGRDVVNRADFERIDQASQGMDIQWKYVPSHSGIRGNEDADRLATEGSRK
ncbi:ribonuclease H1-like isoform X2 [Choloepus didactylus]|uniref:ribonuclease H1-like isoform X2 n=1 Tax=Choloepus didactylus TaxID=27675 RepID=UPI0018A0F794|nr:ribonuclease H1-like isoform X2 [Choloepus didactylus]